MPTFYDRFVECVEHWPKNVALEIQRRDRVESYTYAELRHMAESVGSWLARNGFSVRRAGRNPGRQPSPLGGSVSRRGRRRDAPPYRSTPPCTPTRSHPAQGQRQFAAILRRQTSGDGAGGDRRAANQDCADQPCRAEPDGKSDAVHNLHRWPISTASLLRARAGFQPAAVDSGRRRFPALHLRHDFRSQGRDAHSRQSAGRSGISIQMGARRSRKTPCSGCCRSFTCSPRWRIFCCRW